MNVDPDVNYDELARSTDDFNGAQCKAACVEAGRIILSYTTEKKGFTCTYYRILTMRYLFITCHKRTITLK